MTRTLMGVLAAATLLSAGSALARPDDASKTKGTTGKSGQLQGQTQQGQVQTGMEQELTGEVVRVDENRVYMRHMGAIVPIEINTNTKFSQIQKQDLREGREIRASFTVEGQTTNVAKEIKPSTDQGTPMPSEPPRGTPQPSEPQTPPRTY